MTGLSEIIRPGDVVAVTGFPEFYRALVPALENAVGITLADWDHKPDIYIGEEISFPKRPDISPISISADNAKPGDDRVYVFFVGAEARNRAHLRGLANVVLDATSTTAARVVRTGGEAGEGTEIAVQNGRVVVVTQSV